jgi:hypothetical protein
MVQARKCLVTWSRVQRPLHLGGLGVQDLRLFSIALRACWLWLQRPDPSQPWATLRVTEDKQTSAFFSASVRYILGNGETFLFWTDPWLAGKCLHDLAPEVVDVVSVRRRKQRTVASALADITGALTVQILGQFVSLYQQLQHVQLSSSATDRLEWRWTANGSYSLVHPTKSSAMVFLGYLRVICRYLRFSLISTVDFYYIINKLIILIPDPH